MFLRASIRHASRRAGGLATALDKRTPLGHIRPTAPRIRQCLRNSSTRTGGSGVVGSSHRMDGGERHYNTATTQAHTDTFDDTILLSQFDHHATQEPPAFDLATHDPSSLLILDMHTGLKATDNPTSVTLATFEACVRVERLARAQSLLLQLSSELPHDSPQLLNAHNLFLEGLIKRLRANEGSDMTLVFRWFDEKVVGKFGIKPNSTTFALLLSATLSVKDKTLAQKTAQFYMNMWVEEGHSEEKIFSNPHLTREDVEAVRKLTVRTLRERKPLPDVIQTESSGASIDILNESLRVLTDASESKYDKFESDWEFYRKQEMLEEKALDAALEQWKAEAEAMTKAGVPRLNRTVGAILWQWQGQLKDMIEDEVNAIKRAENVQHTIEKDRNTYGPFFRLLSPEKMAATVLLEIVKLQRSSGISEGMRAATAVSTIGDALEMEYQSEVLAKRREQLPKEFLAELFNSPRKLRYVIRKARQDQELDSMGMGGSLTDWPLMVKMKIGGLLLSMVMRLAYMPVSAPNPEDPETTVVEELPVFYHTFLYMRGHRVGIIKSHPEFAKFFTAPGAEKEASLNPRYLPMVALPRPWLSFNDGGYLATATAVMRTGNSSEQKQYLEAATSRGDLDTLFRALDVLGRTPWMVNHEVFDVFVKIWNTGEALADIPPAKKEQAMPPAPPPDADPAERARWGRDMKAIFNQRANDHSQRCDINLKLVVARAFLNETFYFPHNVDFRGRAYPIPPHFNHIGNDLCRGLLLFGKGKELGESGLRWLKIHLANVFGYDKASFSEREKFAMDHMEDIIDSADNPLEGKRWWLTGEGPWQTLAACYALRNAYKLEDPTKYVCHQHVAMDGSCNGLQHYAALGGDEWGAKHVNLEPSDKPQDIYSGVMEIVNKQIEEEAAAGDPQAKMLKGRIVRKTVKQTVMTYVYGVTFIGARAQIEARLKDDPVLAEISTSERMSLATNLTKKTLGAVRTMFYNASELQRWLVDCALRISKSAPAPQPGSQPTDGAYKDKIPLMNTVIWTTPLGLPVVQPYRKSKFKTVTTNIQKLHLADPTVIEQVLPRKQAAAFPPNFIHSLDATHMLLSALKCHEVGLDFAAVHDSFWTHPSDVDTMNRILRDAFINVHCRDITNEARQEFQVRYKDHYTLYTLPTNSKVAKAIKEFRSSVLKKTSMTEEYELHLEHSRMLLLKSEDPELRQQGEEMVTPYSILLEHEPDFLEKFEELGEDGESAASLASEVEAGAEVEGTMDESKGIEEDINLTEPIDADVSEASEVLEETAEEKPKRRSKQVQQTRLWVPLVFPKVPPKGAFNLNKLKDSLYFFS